MIRTDKKNSHNNTKKYDTFQMDKKGNSFHSTPQELPLITNMVKEATDKVFMHQGLLLRIFEEQINNVQKKGKKDIDYTAIGHLAKACDKKVLKEQNNLLEQLHKWTLKNGTAIEKKDFMTITNPYFNIIQRKQSSLLESLGKKAKNAKEKARATFQVQMLLLEVQYVRQKLKNELANQPFRSVQLELAIHLYKLLYDEGRQEKLTKKKQQIAFKKVLRNLNKIFDKIKKLRSLGGLVFKKILIQNLRVVLNTNRYKALLTRKALNAMKTRPQAIQKVEVIPPSQAKLASNRHNWGAFGKPLIQPAYRAEQIKKNKNQQKELQKLKNAALKKVRFN